MRCELVETMEGLEFRVAPKRSFWTLIVLPVMAVIVFGADYGLDGQGAFARFVGRYVVGGVLLMAFALALFQYQTVYVSPDALVSESRLLGLRRRRRWSAREIESVWFDNDAEAESSLRVKLEGKAVTRSFARGINRDEARMFLTALRQIRGFGGRVSIP